MAGHNPDGSQHYKTIVRDLDEGDVLWAGDGKGEAALDGFGKRLKGSEAELQLKQWIENARTYTIPDLTRVAKSIENHLAGIKAFRDTG